MSEIKTDKLSPRTGSGTVTLGTSGDTFDVQETVGGGVGEDDSLLTLRCLF